VNQNLHDNPLSGQELFYYLKVRNCAHKITSLYPVLNWINSVYSPLINILTVNVINNYITM